MDADIAPLHAIRPGWVPYFLCFAYFKNLCRFPPMPGPPHGPAAPAAKPWWGVRSDRRHPIHFGRGSGPGGFRLAPPPPIDRNAQSGASVAGPLSATRPLSPRVGPPGRPARACQLFMSMGAYGSKHTPSIFTIAVRPIMTKADVSALSHARAGRNRHPRPIVTAT